MAGEQAVNPQRRDRGPETDSTSVEGSLARRTRGPSVHGLGLAGRKVSVCVPQGLLTQVWGTLDAEDGSWLCVFF